MTKRKITNVGTFILSILCLISTIMYLSAFIVLIANIGGVADIITSFLVNYMTYSPQEADSQITLITFELIISTFFALYCFRFYKLSPRMIRNDNELGKRITFMAIFQLLFGMYITGLVALIIGLVKWNKKSTRPVVTVETGIPNQKLQLMGEAIERLKKLREIGAISEEEYYINLNKILEG